MEKNEEISEDLLPGYEVEIGGSEQKFDIDEEFLPDEEYVIGETEDSDTEEYHTSLFNYLNKRVCESSFEMSKGVEGFRGSSVLYEGDSSVLVISDEEEGVGIDLFCFEDEPDTDSVKEWLYEGPRDSFPEATNSIHHELDGEEAYNKVFKITDSSSPRL